MRRDSIRLRVVLGLIGPLILLALINVYLTWRNAVETADLLTDRLLAASAAGIAERIRMGDDGIEALIPPSALAVFSNGDVGERIHYQVRGPEGELIAGDPDVTLPAAPLRDLHTVFFDATFRAHAVRQVALRQPVIGAGDNASAVVIVGSTLKSRDALVDRLWTQSLRGQLLLVAAAALLSAVGVGLGLRPLLRFAREVEEREPDQLQSFDVGALPGELRPLAEALNGAFERVARQIGAQRRFISNAAHQLRTPLSILKAQASYGLREPSLDGKQVVLEAQEARINQMSRLVSQLLSLARAEQGALLMKTDVDFAALTREVLEEFATVAIDKEIDLSFQDEGIPLVVTGHASLLREIVANLVDNAVRYSPPGGTIAVDLGRAEGQVRLTIEDTGPGVSDEDLPHLTERFYRGASADAETGAEGTGLGLAIVRDIIEAHDGSLTLGRRTTGTGLVATVTLPQAKNAEDEPSGHST